ncbi:cation:proton antiporter [Kitasatospora sp. NPDC093806]|uniref:cation:proton antiporter domain-containing protein n=1 Tax=Kitasatospora sp. NPDC093806 TaxID=3155075 RepID=UPI0034284B16
MKVAEKGTAGPASETPGRPAAAELSSTPRARLLGFGLLVVLPVVVGIAALTGGESGGVTEAAHKGGLSQATLLLLAAALVLVTAWAAGALAARLGQPRVIGEICAGILLGPSALGAVAPGFVAWLFPRGVVTGLDGLAQIGLVLFMFGVGQELAAVRGAGREARGAALVTLASFLVPFASGLVVAISLFPKHAGSTVGSTPFALFLGCALGVTAFPVLARILADLGIMSGRIGRLSLYAAAVGDGACWIVLTIALALAQGGGAADEWRTLALIVPAAVVILWPVRIALGKLLAGPAGRSPVAVLTICTAGTAAAAGLTSALGVHQLIGAFLFGLAWPVGHGRPAEGASAKGVSAKGRSAKGASGKAERAGAGHGPADEASTEPVATLARLLMPFFFLGFGLSLDLRDLALNADNLLLLVVLLAVAMFSKVIGAGLGGLWSGLPRREALGLGVLMNTRGLTELVVLGIGHQAGVIDGPLFAALVLVTLATTAMTGPVLKVLKLLTPGGARPTAPAHRPES